MEPRELRTQNNKIFVSWNQKNNRNIFLPNFTACFAIMRAMRGLVAINSANLIVSEMTWFAGNTLLMRPDNNFRFFISKIEEIGFEFLENFYQNPWRLVPKLNSPSVLLPLLYSFRWLSASVVIHQLL